MRRSKRTGAVKPKARRKPPKKAKTKRAAPKAKTVTFTTAELKALNRATTMLSLAQQLLEEIWAPIRTKYAIAREIQYDRTTGKVS